MTINMYRMRVIHCYDLMQAIIDNTLWIDKTYQNTAPLEHEKSSYLLWPKGSTQTMKDYLGRLPHLPNSDSISA